MDIIQEYKRLHKETNPDRNEPWFPGKSIRPHVNKIAGLVRETDSKTLLDFGCGQGRQYSEMKVHNEWGILPELYDPAVDGISELPDKVFDGVICTDVLEHIPEDNVDQVLSDIFSRADKFVFLSIALFLTGDLLPDGRDLHCTVESPEWWKERIRPFQKTVCHISWRYRKKWIEERLTK